MLSWKNVDLTSLNFQNFHKKEKDVKSIWINGKTYLPEQIISGSYTNEDQGHFERKVLDFIHGWLLGIKTFTFMTSGSTGRPKIIRIQRQRMLISAHSTMKFLHLKSGNCLLCLDPNFIAGTMMIVRALTHDMHLYALEPSADPFKKLPDDIGIDLCALVPLQVHEILQDDSSLEKFNRVRNVLIGGSDLSDELKNKIGKFKNQIFHTFGMTETVSHIALRRMNGDNPDEYFHALPGVKLSVDDRGCLVISGKVTGNTPLITNDQVELISQSKFKWLGRNDHIINSGGIKILIEVLEKKIESILREKQAYRPFFIAGVPDKKLGQKTAIVFESKGKPANKEQLIRILKNELKVYEMPKQWRVIPEFRRTSTQKMDRNQSLKLSIEID
jgi:O-succinylbenzoic acid--CoA ligase